VVSSLTHDIQSGTDSLDGNVRTESNHAHVTVSASEVTTIWRYTNVYIIIIIIIIVSRHLAIRLRVKQISK